MAPITARARRAVRGSAACLAVAFAFLLPVNTVPGLPTQAEQAPPLVGFSFTNQSANYEGMDPMTALGTLLRELHPDIVRLPVYWSDVEPQQGVFVYGPLDNLLAVIDTYNRTASRPVRVVLAIGARNMGFPEVYLPDWLDDGRISVANAEKAPDYRAYVLGTLARYAGNPLVYAWQVENEGLDDVTTLRPDPVGLPYATVAAEVREVRRLDQGRPVVVTTFNSSSLDLDRRNIGPLGWLFQLLPGPHASGHPADALKAGDIMGLDVYVATPFTPLSDVSAPNRIRWKADSLSYWADTAGAEGKQVWITEMQGYPWVGMSGFTTTDLHMSALAYRDKGLGAIIVWGVEDWLGDPVWMRAGKAAISLMRSQP